MLLKLKYILILFLCACTSAEETETWDHGSEFLMEEEFASREKIEELSSSAGSISGFLDYGENYFIYFDSGKNIYLSRRRTPVFSIDDYGFWQINASSTAIQGGDTKKIPVISVGKDGHWWVNGEDSGIRGDIEGCPVIRYVVDEDRQMAFCFDDSTLVVIPKREQFPYFRNSPLPMAPDTLRVLALGNSYTLDATAYLEQLLQNSGLDCQRIGIYVACHAGASLEYWCSQYLLGEEHTLLRMVGNVDMKKIGRLRDLLAQHWDVVVLQQNSANAIDYSTFSPYLRYLIGKIKEKGLNKDVALAWQMVWSYWTGFGGSPYGTDRYQCIIEAVKQQMRHDGIDIVIPIGTAIENARRTVLQTAHDLTRDGTHIAHGIGRYIAACTWYESILAPIYGKTMLGNSMLYELTENDKSDSKYESADVTEKNRSVCQRCAWDACQNKFEKPCIDR